jgi:hypothetical protein
MEAGGSHAEQDWPVLQSRVCFVVGIGLCGIQVM